MSLDPKDVVRNSAQLIDVFGAWPSFHDSEITEVRLQRRGRDDFEGPVLFICFHLFAGRRDASSETGITWSEHTLATFRFGFVSELELRGVNQQNAIADLRIEPAGLLTGSAVHGYRVTLFPSFGISCSFLCESMELV